MTQVPMQQLSSTLSVEYTEDEAVLYNTSWSNPRRIIVLTASEVTSLFDALHDGRCPVCLVEIPLNDVVCDECFDKARFARGG